MNTIWIIVTGLLLIKIVLCAYCLVLTAKLLSNSKTEVQNTVPPRELLCPQVFFIIPLLREQSRVESLINEFMQDADIDLPFKLVLVTTSRETEDNSGNFDGTTADVINKFCTGLSNENKLRLIHLHYPNRNRVVAEQLNYAINELDTSPDKKYFCFYNADGQKERRTYQAITVAVLTGKPVFQQSSLFVRNINALLSARHFLESAFGLYQSSWTVQHEISRYTISRKFIRWLPKWIDNITLAHCVMHGLLIRSDILRECGGIPDLTVGGEDIALGFILRCRGYHIDPIPVLENSEMPTSLKVLWKQLSWWFVALTGYATFDQLLVDGLPEKRILSQKVLGLWDMVKWLLKGGVIIFYLFLSMTTGHMSLGILFYLIYVCLPVIYILHLWKNLPETVFPRPSLLQLSPAIMVYPIVPILRSVPAIIGLILLFRLRNGLIPEKPKTE